MKALVVGGSSGIGLSIALLLGSRSDVEVVYILDKNPIPKEYQTNKMHYIQMDLSNPVNHSVLDAIGEIDALYITAGFGHLKYFQELSYEYIQNSFAVNSVAPIEIIRHYYNRLLNDKPFYCAVMVSIAGRLSSPMFSVYSATKAALSKFIEAVNVELEVQGFNNRILEVSPGSLQGTSFSGGKTDPQQTESIAAEIIAKSEKSLDLFIPQYEEVFKDVIQRYQTDAHQFGVDSYWYKQKRLQNK